MSLFRNNKNGAKRSAENDDTYIGKYKISDTALSVAMFISVAAALVAVALCIFVIGNRFSDSGDPSDSTDSPYVSGSETESRSEPNDGSTDRPNESGTNGVNNDTTNDSENSEPSDTGSSETDTSIITDQPTDTETEEPTETESDKHPDEKDEPVGYVPTTPNDVSVIGYYDMQSKNAILVDCSTNTSIAQRLADQAIYPASLTKIMTVVVAYENINDLNDTFRMTADLVRKAANQGASLAGFWAGSVLTMKDLMYGAVLPSGAEATYALAQYVAGSEESFAALMNKKAAELGMTKTHFVTVTGLHDPNHYSTVRDMATLMNYAMSIPAIKEIMSAVEYRTTDGKNLTSLVFAKTGHVHKTYNNGVTMIAGKSGYTPEAAYCLATYYESDDGKRYILITAGAPNGSYAPVNDAKVLIEEYIK